MRTHLDFYEIKFLVHERKESLFLSVIRIKDLYFSRSGCCSKPSFCRPALVLWLFAPWEHHREPTATNQHSEKHRLLTWAGGGWWWEGADAGHP